MKPTLKKWLFRPFDYISDYKALLIGVTAILLAGIINRFGNIHFDGVLDIHIGNKQTSFLVFISEGFINWLVISFLLFISGLIFSSSSIRFIDVVGTQAMARWPLFISSLTAIIIPHQSVQNYLQFYALGYGPEVDIQPYQLIVFGLLVLIMIATIIWMIILMYRAFSIASNLKGNKAIVIFIVTLIVAEAVSKYLISFVS